MRLAADTSGLMLDKQAYVRNGIDVIALTETSL